MQTGQSIVERCTAADPTVKHHLLVASSSPALMAALVARCARQLDVGKSLSVKDLMKASIKVATAAVTAKWASTELIEKRRQTCAACPHRKTASGEARPIATKILGEHDYCGACGCAIEWKTKLLREDCPVEGEVPGLSRWAS